MPKPLRNTVLLAAALTGLAACNKTGDVPPSFAGGPVSVLGEGRLAVSGGGITGAMTPVPAGRDIRMVLGPDSAYAEYLNGKLTRTSTFQYRRQPSRFGGPDEQLLVIKTGNPTSGQPLYCPHYVTTLTADNLDFTTGGGCALNAEYVRTKAASWPVAAQ